MDNLGLQKCSQICLDTHTARNERLCQSNPEYHHELLSRAIQLGKEILPLLERESVPVPVDYEDLVFKQLYNWLADPNRTVNGLNNAEGPLWKRCFNNKHYPTICLRELTIEVALDLWFIAFEALAARKPILQGPWEYSAWLLVKFRKSSRIWMDKSIKILISDHLNVWIINMMANCECCPNPYLRLELMAIFGDFGIVYTSLEPQAFDAVMFACWALEKNYTRFYHTLDDIAVLRSIKVVFNRFSAEFLQAYDQKLSGKLLFQVSVMIHDVSCSYGFNQNRDTGTFEVNVLTSLFQRISTLALNILWNLNLRLCISDSCVSNVTNTLFTIIKAFRKSCVTPQLVYVTASCIMDVLNMVVPYNISYLDSRGNLDDRSLSPIENMIWALCGYTNINVTNTPVGQVLDRTYQDCLCSIREKK